jgi:hypothetical protein
MDNINLLYNLHLVDKINLQTRIYAFKKCIKDFKDNEISKEEFSCFTKIVNELSEISDKYKKKYE